jgi:KUP system potassium uptake protein
MAQTSVPAPSADNGAGVSSHGRHFWALTLSSLGVVYGDIGTSPLYAFRESVTAAQAAGTSASYAVTGVLSLMLWSLFLVVTVKYVLVLLRADNKGEGGTFALMALAQSVAGHSAPMLLLLGVVGASFFYGDAVLTPAISVLSAVEGLKLVAPAFEALVLPLAVLILIALFMMQSRGTSRVGALFGPITAVWFLVLAMGGIIHILGNPHVLAALNPIYGVEFLAVHGLVGLSTLGLVFLTVTGAEALYADLGHFGRKPIQTAWLGFVLPALALNYLGQGALVLAQPDALDNPFFRLYPDWALLPMVVLATLATIIASQAVITGAYSLTRQAFQLGLLPRFTVHHTSESVSGQIYMPRLNLMLLIGVLMVVMIFRNSTALAASYGVAVSGDMVISSVMAFFVIWRYWRWPLWGALALIAPFLLIEQAFFTANMLKLFEGGWFPLLVGGLVGLVMMTWVRGSRLLAKKAYKDETDLDWLIRKLEAKPPHRVPGTAVFLTADATAAPTSLLHNLKHNRVLHERNIVLSIKAAETPRVSNSERIAIERLSDGFIRVTATFGFMETPSVPKVLMLCRRKDLNIDMAATSFFLSRRSLRPTVDSQMPEWQEKLFIALAHSAQDATTYFQIPTDRVVEVGTQVAV